MASFINLGLCYIIGFDHVHTLIQIFIFYLRILIMIYWIFCMFLSIPNISYYFFLYDSRFFSELFKFIFHFNVHFQFIIEKFKFDIIELLLSLFSLIVSLNFLLSLLLFEKFSLLNILFNQILFLFSSFFFLLLC